MARIAVASVDGVTVAEHFSGARQYVVLDIERGEVVAREVRAKPGHVGTGRGKGRAGGAGRGRHIDAAVAPVADCHTVVCGAMGDGAYEGLKRSGVRPLLTGLKTVDEVARAAAEGRLVDDPERVTRSPGIWPVA